MPYEAQSVDTLHLNARSSSSSQSLKVVEIEFPNKELTESFLSV